MTKKPTYIDLPNKIMVMSDEKIKPQRKDIEGKWI